jgi:hypothetical protein
MKARYAKEIREALLTLGVAAFGAAALGPAPALAETAAACPAKAERMCRSIEDPDERERCRVEREVECEIVGPSNARKGATGEPPHRVRQACQEDFERVCADVVGEGRRGEGVRCLREHRDDLTDGCRAALDARATAGRRERAGVCRDEIRELCPDAQDRPSMRICVRENRDQLSDTCQQALAKRARRRGHGGGDGLGKGQGRN